MSLSPGECENHIGSARIQTAASNNFVLTAFSSFERLAECQSYLGHAGLYQEIAQTLIRGLNTNRALGNLAAKLASVADHAHSLRRLDIVNHAGQLMLTLPLSRELESVAQYYQALSLNRGGRGDITSAESLFEKAADNGSTRYRARAMAALGTNCLASGDHQSAMSFYREVTAILTRDRVLDLMTSYVATRMTAVIRGMNGDHRGALADLENMFPLVRMASSQQPYAYYDYLNTLAVELSEVERLEEARRAVEIALASPFASAYPEWRETRDEIELKGRRASRSTAGLSQGPPEASNVVSLPPPKRGSSATAPAHESQTPARVIKFPPRTSSTPERNEGKRQSEAYEKRRIMLDKLYDMFLSALQESPIDSKLVEKLYGVFLENRKQS